MTPGEAETKREKAVEFLRRIGRDDDAETFEAMGAREYAEHKGAQLLENPTRRNPTMAHIKSKPELQAELDDANEYIEQLEAKLDSIAGIAAGEDEEEEEDDDENGDDQD
jgi:hypothetical protein